MRRGAAVVGLVVTMVWLGALLSVALAGAQPRQARQDVELGVTFSPRYARSLGLDPREIYLRSLNELGVAQLRLPVYWDEVERTEGVYDLSAAEFYLVEAERRGVRIISVLGYKVPRWPECFAPQWVERLDTQQKRTAILRLIRAEVENLRGFENISHWQVENEPFFAFGQCGDFSVLDEGFVAQETAIVRQLDRRPVVITDSGEFSTWASALQLADTFGSTMYRSVWFEYVGLLSYPIPPTLYAVKDQVVRALLSTDGETVVIELQAEPWFMTGGPITDTPVSRQVEVFPIGTLRNHLRDARQTGFSAVYLWGVEWWYWMEQRGHPEYLVEARELFGQVPAVKR